jgi:clan AA aspartic protease (TIGR02281 family)
MRGAIVLRVSILLLSAAGAQFARQFVSTSSAPAQSALTDKQIRPTPVQLPSFDRAVQLPAVDRPGRVTPHDIVSTSRFNGNFFFQTEVNGATMPMMFDTGSRWVALRAEDAERAGIDVSSLNFSVHTSTANGVGSAALVTIKVMRVGNITRTNIQAVVMRPGALAINLLGQSFMSTMAGFSTEGDRLTLRGN